MPDYPFTWQSGHAGHKHDPPEAQPSCPTSKTRLTLPLNNTTRRLAGGQTLSNCCGFTTLPARGRCQRGRYMLAAWLLLLLMMMLPQHHNHPKHILAGHGVTRSWPRNVRLCCSCPHALLPATHQLPAKLSSESCIQGKSNPCSQHGELCWGQAGGPVGPQCCSPPCSCHLTATQSSQASENSYIQEDLNPGLWGCELRRLAGGVAIDPQAWISKVSC
jgi:hypothetical protein